MAHKEKGFRFPDDWTEEEIREAHEAYTDSITRRARIAGFVLTGATSTRAE
jgi:hypothetical protein